MADWDPTTMATGVESIDTQHKTLLARLGELQAAMSIGRGQQEIEDLLAFLEDYTLKHFAHEESCMNQYRCPIAARNKSEHAIFVKRVKDFKAEYTAKGSSTALVLTLRKELSDWLINHIKQIDLNLRDCAKTAAKKV